MTPVQKSFASAGSGVSHKGRVPSAPIEEKRSRVQHTWRSSADYSCRFTLFLAQWRRQQTETARVGRTIEKNLSRPGFGRTGNPPAQPWPDPRHGLISQGLSYHLLTLWEHCNISSDGRYGVVEHCGSFPERRYVSTGSGTQNRNRRCWLGTRRYGKRTGLPRPA